MEISKKLRIEFNKRFANGEQYIEIASDDLLDEPEIRPIEKLYVWELREVYNKILPIIEFFSAEYKSNIDKKEWEELIYGKNGLVERLIPLQKRFNDIKNRKAEFINRMSYGVFVAEDGSIDLDDICQNNVQTGKVIVYRQGSVAPKMLPIDKTAYEIYNAEIEQIKDEINDIVANFERTHLNTSPKYEKEFLI